MSLMRGVLYIKQWCNVITFFTPDIKRTWKSLLIFLHLYSVLIKMKLQRKSNQDYNNSVHCSGSCLALLAPTAQQYTIKVSKWFQNALVTTAIYIGSVTFWIATHFSYSNELTANCLWNYVRVMPMVIGKNYHTDVQSCKYTTI